MGDIYGKGNKGAATKLHSKIVRTLGYCERCGNEDYSKLQAAHIIGRKYGATRTRLTNALCLCASCHAFFTDHPREFSKYVTTTWAQDFYEHNFELTQMNLKFGQKTYWLKERNRLKDILNRIEKGESVKDIRLDEKHTLDT